MSDLFIAIATVAVFASVFLVGHALFGSWLDGGNE